ncbi:MAG: hypothetical protein WAT66_10605 [Actinomycetota bacterium]
MRRFIRSTANVQAVVAACAVLGAIAVGASGVAVFRSTGAKGNQSVWHLVFADSATTGYVRVAVVALALYATASSAALLVGRRWMKGLGTGGLQMDDARVSDEVVEELKSRASQAEEARDEAIRIAAEVTRWLNQM